MSAKTHLTSNEQSQILNLIDSATDAIITLNESHRVVLFNQAAEKMFGHAMQSMLGNTIDVLIPPEYHSSHHQHVTRFAEKGESVRQMGKDLVLYGMHANGARFPIEASISKALVNGTVLLTVILRDISTRVAAQAALSQAKTDLKKFFRTSQEARENEKRRIARELHDELGQSLTALKLDASWLQKKLQDSSDLQEHVQNMVKLIDRTITSSRRISADLRPLMLDDLGLAEAIEWLCKDSTRSTGLSVKLNTTGLAHIADTAVASALYRVVQEAVNNVIKHSQASKLSVNIESDDHVARLMVQDNGKGMSLEDEGKRGSYGLMGIKERIYMLDGTVSINSARGSGTNLTVSIPLNTQSNSQHSGQVSNESEK